jgi:hypothetical protein
MIIEAARYTFSYIRFYTNESTKLLHVLSSEYIKRILNTATWKNVREYGAVTFPFTAGLQPEQTFLLTLSLYTALETACFHNCYYVHMYIYNYFRLWQLFLAKFIKVQISDIYVK